MGASACSLGRKYINYQNCDRNTWNWLFLWMKYIVPISSHLLEKTAKCEWTFKFFSSSALLNETCFYYFLLFSSIFVNHSRCLSTKNGNSKDCFMEMKLKRTYCNYALIGIIFMELLVWSILIDTRLGHLHINLCYKWHYSTINFAGVNFVKIY